MVTIYNLDVLLFLFGTSLLFHVQFCCFLACIQISQEAGQVVWYSYLFQSFPQFIVIHTVKGFAAVMLQIFKGKNEQISWTYVYRSYFLLLFIVRVTRQGHIKNRRSESSSKNVPVAATFCVPKYIHLFTFANDAEAFVSLLFIEYP